jgi:thiamine-phosphate pyrophosphorylase
MVETRPVAAAAVVALRGESVLLVRRGSEPRLGEWSFPGGSIEPGETARAAAAREAWEETSLRLRVLDTVDVYDALFPAPDGGTGFHYCVADFLAEPEDPLAEPVAGDDALEARWVPLADLAELGIARTLGIVLRRALWLRSQSRPPSLGAPDGRPSGMYEVPCWSGYLNGALYAVTADRGPGRSHEEVAAAALAGGARIVQVRDKGLEARALLEVVYRIDSLARAAGAICIVDDRVDVAATGGAAGAHLGQSDLPAADARRLLGPSRCLGVSVESAAQAVAAELAGADYLGVGDIYGTTSKRDAGAPVGLEHLRALRHATSLPIVAIGGITSERVEEVISAGADAVAVISAVADAPDMKAAARDLASRAERAWAVRRAGGA